MTLRPRLRTWALEPDVLQTKPPSPPTPYSGMTLGHLSKPWFSHGKHGDDNGAHLTGGLGIQLGSAGEILGTGLPRATSQQTTAVSVVVIRTSPLWAPCPTCQYLHLAGHATVYKTSSCQSTNLIPKGYGYQAAETGCECICTGAN